MAFGFNPFTGNFDLKGSGGGGGSSYIDGEVQNFSALPQTVGTPPVDSAYLVREAEGTWLLNRKPAGIYIRTADTGVRADDWTHAGAFPDVFNDANFLLYDNADSTKNLAFQLSGITTGTTRTITVPDSNVTLPSPSLLAFTDNSNSDIEFGTQELTLRHTGTNDTPYINVTDGTDYALLGVRQGEMFLQGSNPDVRIEQGGGNLANILMVEAKLEDAQSSGGHFATITADGELTDNRTLTVPNASGTIARTEDFAAPPAIGNTTPAAATFTSIRIGSTSTFEAGIAKTNLGVMGFNRQDSPTTYHAAIGFDGTLRGFVLNAASFLGFSNANATSISSADTRLFRDAAGVLAQYNGANAQEYRLYGTFTSATNYQRLAIKTKAVTLSALTGASVATTGGFIPDGAVLVGLTTRVSTAITGATGYDIGDGSDADRWGANIGIALNTSSDNTNWTAGTIECFTAAQEVTLTAVGSNFTGGAVVIVAHYLAGEAD